MLSGQRLFGGETISDTLASVLKTEPSWKALPASTPQTLRRVLRSCLQAVGGAQTPVPYLQTPFSETHAQFSPDGQWMAYASNESGQPQIYVQTIPAGGAKRQVSTTGGDQPRWRRDGKELFYISADRKLMAAPVKTDAGFEAGSPQPLFDMQPLYVPTRGRFAYQPTADGQRFLVTAPVNGPVTTPITVVLNWQAGLKK